MSTLTQVFYNKLAGASREWLTSKAGRQMIAKVARHIKAKEGRKEAHYFVNLMTVSEVIP